MIVTTMRPDLVPDLLPQEKTDISLFVVQQRVNRFFRNDSKYPESGGDRDLPEPLFPIAEKDKFSDLRAICGPVMQARHLQSFPRLW